MGTVEPCGSIASLHMVGMRDGNMWKAGQVDMGNDGVSLGHVQRSFDMSSKYQSQE